MYKGTCIVEDMHTVPDNPVLDDLPVDTGKLGPVSIRPGELWTNKCTRLSYTQVMGESGADILGYRDYPLPTLYP